MILPELASDAKHHLLGESQESKSLLPRSVSTDQREHRAWRKLRGFLKVKNEVGTPVLL